MPAVPASQFRHRADVSVYNESLLFVIASKSLGGRDCAQEPGSDEWTALVRAGIFLPVMLNGDKGVNVRVIVNDDLTPEEAAEACAHVAGRLRVRDGRLALLGGSEYLDGEEADESMEVVKVPKGDYRMDVHACFAGVNGPYLPAFEEHVLKGPVADWFRRTRPGVDVPRWLADHCGPPACGAHVDPPEYLDFIVRLTPWDGPTKVEPPELDEQGCLVPTPVRPERCPVGIVMRPAAG